MFKVVVGKKNWKNLHSPAEYYRLYKLFAEAGIAPKVLSELKDDTFYVEKGEELPEEVTEDLWAKIKPKIEKMHSLGYYHGDLSMTNCVAIEDDVKLIDFGMTFQKKDKKGLKMFKETHADVGDIEEFELDMENMA